MNLLSGINQRLRSDVFGRFERRIWILTVIQLFTSAGFSICLPFLALYLYQERGLPMTFIGTIFLIAGLCSAVTHIIGGVLTDRLGRRRVLLGVTAVSIFMYGGLAALIGLSAPIWAIVVVYITARSVLTTIRPAISAMVADLAPPERLTETYGLLRVGGNVGFAAGPALGGYLMTFIPYAWLFGVTTLTWALSFVLIFFLLRESYRVSSEQVTFRSLISVAGDRRFLMFTGLSALVFLTMAQFGSTLSVFTVDRLGFSTAQYGLLLTINGLLVATFQYPVARSVNRLERSTGLILGSILYALGYLSLGWVGSFGWGVAVMVIITAGEIVFAPLTPTVVAELSPEDKRGRYMGFLGLGQTLGMSFGPLVGGVLLDTFETKPPFIWGIIASVAFVAALGFYRWGATRNINST